MENSVTIADFQAILLEFKDREPNSNFTNNNNNRKTRSYFEQESQNDYSLSHFLRKDIIKF